MTMVVMWLMVGWWGVMVLVEQETKQRKSRYVLILSPQNRPADITTFLTLIFSFPSQEAETVEQAELGELRKRRVEADKARLQREVDQLNARIDTAKNNYSMVTSTLKDSEKKLQAATRYDNWDNAPLFIFMIEKLHFS